MQIELKLTNYETGESISRNYVFEDGIAPEILSCEGIEEMVGVLLSRNSIDGLSGREEQEAIKICKEQIIMKNLTWDTGDCIDFMSDFADVESVDDTIRKYKDVYEERLGQGFSRAESQEYAEGYSKALEDIIIKINEV